MVWEYVAFVRSKLVKTTIWLLSPAWGMMNDNRLWWIPLDVNKCYCHPIIIIWSRSHKPHEAHARKINFSRSLTSSLWRKSLSRNHIQYNYNTFVIQQIHLLAEFCSMLKLIIDQEMFHLALSRFVCRSVVYEYGPWILGNIGLDKTLANEFCRLVP